MKEKFNEFLNSDRAWLAVFGLVVVLLFGYVIFKNNEAGLADDVGQVASDTADTVAKLAGPAFGLVVPAQIPGNAVLVRYAKTEEPLWLSVNELDENGQPTNLILGAMFLRTPGVYQDRNIELLRPTQESGRYGVVIYRDDGSSRFSAAPTLLLRDENGKITSVPFAVEVPGSRGTD